MLVALYRSPQDNQKRGRPHRTPAQLLQLLLRLLLRWFPDREFLFAGDQNYGSHEMATLAPQTQGWLHTVSKFYPNANLYEPPNATCKACTCCAPRTTPCQRTMSGVPTCC